MTEETREERELRQARNARRNTRNKIAGVLSRRTRNQRRTTVAKHKAKEQSAEN